MNYDMARPNKKGLDYFPFDVDFFEDEKIGAISGEFGIKGEITAIKLLCAVYRNGYFVVWNEPLKIKLLKSLPGINSELLEQIVNRLVRWGFFNKSCFSLDKILTSEGIQKRYFEAIKRRKSNENYPYLLFNVNNNDVNVSNNPVNVYKSTQRKEKEINNPSIVSPLGIDPRFGDKILSIDSLKSEIFEWHSNWIEQVAMKVHLSIDQTKMFIDNFFNHLVITGVEEKSVKDFKHHFGNWLKKEMKNERKEAGNATDERIY